MKVLDNTCLPCEASADVRLGRCGIGQKLNLAIPEKKRNFKVVEASSPRYGCLCQDEAELSLFPAWKRCWMVRGHQCKERAPGVYPPKWQECGATNWRTGAIVPVRAKKRNAVAFCRLAEKCMQRSAKRKRQVIIVTDGARFHKPE
ncbi:MAG TPA: hypothetical protein VLX61_15250 [Anaerolineales bacterium]|nr:hypothetical protein [Anaerolineales bacterium]